MHEDCCTNAKPYLHLADDAEQLTLQSAAPAHVDCMLEDEYMARPSSGKEAGFWLTWSRCIQG